MNRDAFICPSGEVLFVFVVFFSSANHAHHPPEDDPSTAAVQCVYWKSFLQCMPKGQHGEVKRYVVALSCHGANSHEAEVRLASSEGGINSVPWAISRTVDEL